MSDDERDNDIESDADKRAHHNALERKRRDHIKDSFSSLREVLPAFQGDKVRASRAQILKKAADYIQSMRRKNSAHQQDIDDLKRQNKALEEQIRSLEQAKKTGNFAAAAVLESTHISNNKPNTVGFDGDSDSEASSVNSDSNPDLDESNQDIMTMVDDTPKKRLKMNTDPPMRT